MSGPEITLSEAVISQDERHRYSLTRRWGYGPAVCCWIMLNPSTADATTDDPTIRRCLRFTQGWGYDALTVVNLYAWRATDPADLRNAQRAGLLRRPINCLGTTKTGAPRHPLYLRADTPRHLYNGRTP